MSIIEFLESKKTQRDYNKLCEKMKKTNVRLSENDNGNKIIESKVGDLEYSFNDLEQKNVLKLNGFVIFDKVDIHGDTTYLTNDIEMIKSAKNNFSKNQNEALSLNQIKDEYQKITKRLLYVNFDGSNQSKIKNNMAITENNFDNISYSNREELSSCLTIDTLRLGQDIIYSSRKTEKGTQITIMDFDALTKISEKIENKLQQGKPDVNNRSLNNKASKRRIF